MMPYPTFENHSDFKTLLDKGSPRMVIANTRTGIVLEDEERS